MAYMRMALGISLIVFTGGSPASRRKAAGHRIIGGVEAPEGYAPHTVALVSGDVIRSLVCGGSIVSISHILTAAHCIDAMVVRSRLIHSSGAVVGSNQWSSEDKVVPFSQYTNHPEWNVDTIKNDIGVLQLSEELELSARVAVIALSFVWIGGGEDSYVTGWGRVGPTIEDDVVNLFPIPENLQLLHLATLSPSACAAGLREVADDIEGMPSMNSSIEICTFHSVGHGMCDGDSGGALVSKRSGDQIGVVSWGLPCARGAPDVFARISAFEDFLVTATSTSVPERK